MANEGYSGTPLIKKLGIQPHMKLLLINVPADYSTWLESDISKQLMKRNELPDFIHLFEKDYLGFEKDMQQVNAIALKNANVIVWASWYKKSAGIPTDLTEDLIRNYALKNNPVDIKVCAVTEQWSGLKLVVPLAKRK